MQKEKKFDDDLNIYVFTTRYIIEDKLPITLICHDVNGDWQFMGNGDFGEEDARLISLSEMIEHDPTILLVSDLPFGKQAYRKDAYSEWEIKE